MRSYYRDTPDRPGAETGGRGADLVVEVAGTQRIRPVLDRVFPFDDAPEAFRHYLGGTARGKVVVTFAPNHERT
jgi:hypothetical protein